MESKEAYIVTTGYYSDYRIVGVFDDRKLAEEFVSQTSDARIEAHTLNPFTEQVRDGSKPYQVQMRRDGYAVNIYCKTDNPGDWTSTPDFYFIWDSAGAFAIQVFARDEQHAIKIANETRTMILANNLWGNEHSSVVREMLGVKVDDDD